MKKRNRTVNSTAGTPAATRTPATKLAKRRRGDRVAGPAGAGDGCLVRAAEARRAGAERRVVDAGRRYGGCDPLMDFSLLRLRRGGWHEETTSAETLFVLLNGRMLVEAGGTVRTAARSSLFDEGPTSLHCGAGEHVAIESQEPTELAVIRTGGSSFQGVQWSTPAECASENRGAGLVQGACQRIVRTIFDHATRPESGLVAGEVVNFPGRWSSYPPHHHAQPEIYHYRFTQPQGYGHAELGDAVVKVGDGDTVVIPGGLDHAQVSAPGYGMYYLWVVRHLPRRPYKGFTFTREHTWLLDPKQQGWMPRPAHAVTP